MKRFSLNARMTLTINGVILLALTALIFFQVRQSYRSAREQAFKTGEETTYRYASQVDAVLNGAMLTARTMAQTFEGMKLAWVDDRSLYNSLLSQVLKSNTNFFAGWSAWEPDALDGKDSTFANKSGQDATGRFIPVWVQAAGDVKLDKLADYNTPGKGDYYLLARNSGRETLLEPRTVKYAGQSAVVITVAAPIHYNGAVVGVAGFDIPLANLQKLIESIRPYGTGSASLISASGQRLADAQSDLVGTTLDDPQIKQAIAAGKIFTGIVPSAALKTDVYKVLVPVHAGDAQTHWSLAVDLPMDKIMADAQSAMYRALILGVLTLVLMVAVVVWLSRSIALPLTRIANDLNAAAVEVQTASHQTQTSSQSLADASGQQAASLEETSSSLEEMSSITKQNAENAQKANDLAKQAREAADKGVIDMQAMSAAMEDIKVSSDGIAKIIKTIDEIAFQTNILALNAAVEAARAGEAGMGFAVVADEVRNLAQRSAQAAKETAGKIEGAIGKTAQGVELSQKVATRLNEIVTKARQVDQLAAEVASACREQTQGIAQINAAVGETDKVTQSNAANAEESAAAAQQLNSQARTMKQAVGELMELIGGSRKNLATEDVAGDQPGVPAAPPKPLASKNGDHGLRLRAKLPPGPSRRDEVLRDGNFRDF